MEMKTRIVLLNDEECCLCGKRLPIDTEAYMGYIEESPEERVLCERCSVIDDNYTELDLSIDTDLLSVLYEIGYFNCECGSDTVTLKLTNNEDKVIAVCKHCGKEKEFSIDEESLERFFIANSDKFGAIDYEAEDEDEDYIDEGYTEEEIEKYTDDYCPDTSYMRTLIDSEDNPFIAIHRED